MKARVDSLEVLRSFRTALWKFSETASAAIAEAEGEVHRTLVWLETEQLTYWDGQIRKRHDWVERCKEAYREKTLFKDAAGHRSSGFDERKELEKAQRALEEAEEKYANVKRYTRVLQKELQNYAGAVQRFSTDVVAELPNTVAKIEKMEEQLEQYVALKAPEAELEGPSSSGEGGMVRGGELAAVRPGSPEAQTANPSGEDWRDSTPKDWERAKAVDTENVNFLATGQPLNGPTRVAIATLDVKRDIPAGTQSVAVSEEIGDSTNIFLHRTKAVNESDSGWFIGSGNVESSPGQMLRVSVDRLLGVRPDLREILALPMDFVVVISAGTVAAVYNSKGQDVWHKKR